MTRTTLAGRDVAGTGAAAGRPESRPGCRGVLEVVVAGGLRGFRSRTAAASELDVGDVHGLLLLRLAEGTSLGTDELASAVGLATGGGAELTARLHGAGLAAWASDDPTGVANVHLTSEGKVLADETLSQLRVALAARVRPPAAGTARPGVPERGAP